MTRPRLIITIGAGVLVVLGVFVILIATGVIWPNRALVADYPVRGVDVSSYQGDIDWDVLAVQDIDYAYIKATEGSSSVDSRFAGNWAGASDTGLLFGAYHFMSFETTGDEQAAHIIDTVPDDGTLPLAVDLEFYGDFFDHPPSRDRVDAILTPLLERLERHYGAPPVIYATPAAYDRYLSGGYADYPIWIRSVAAPPDLDDGRDWAFWQYSSKERLDGYHGDERFIDMNAFRGTRGELADLAG